MQSINGKRCPIYRFGASRCNRALARVDWPRSLGLAPGPGGLARRWLIRVAVHPASYTARPLTLHTLDRAAPPYPERGRPPRPGTGVCPGWLRCGSRLRKVACGLGVRIVRGMAPRVPRRRRRRRQRAWRSHCSWNGPTCAETAPPAPAARLTAAAAAIKIAARRGSFPAAAIQELVSRNVAQVMVSLIVRDSCRPSRTACSARSGSAA
ncbi:hypothetical protein VIMS_01737 [Mycobacterium marinum]|nr:hypothetical protein VIMS_01737 [Mycobacterium marinum]